MTVSAHARALVRWRRGLAMHVSHLVPASRCVQCHGHGGSEEAGDCGACEGTGDGRREFALQLLRGGQGFDVAAARAYALDLIALEDEHAVFTDWTMARGKGPDNRDPGAFGGCGHCRGSGTEPKGPLSGHSEPPDCYACDGLGDEKPGGWPDKLAREWGTVPCGACNGTRSRLVQDPMTDGLSTTRLWCEPCKGTGRKPRPEADRRAPQGRILARVGRRLRDMLDGKGDYKHAARQPAECGHWTAQDGQPMRTVIVDHVPTVVPCGCHGTGHNLRGYLPEVEVTPAMRWRVADSFEAGTDREIVRHPQWWDGLDIGIGLGEFPVTRVGPRGEHCRTLELGQEPWEPAGSPRVHMYTPWGQEAEYPKRFKVRDLAPRWRRGELLHAQQRRERAEAVEYALEFVAPEASA